MRKWTRRIGGSGTSFVSGIFFSKAFQVVDFVHGLPGSIDDSSAWKAVVAKVSLSTAVYAAGMIGGILLASSEWWWPPLSGWFHRIRSNLKTHEVEVPVVFAAGDARINSFKELEQLIKRHRKAVRPARQLLALPLWDPVWKLGFDADREELIAELDALRIPHPRGDADRAVWFNYLVGLDAACRIGDVEEARSLYRSDSQGEVI